MRQVLESDRKIRAVSLIKFSGFTLSEIDEAIQSTNSQSSTQSQDDSTADAMVSSLRFDSRPTASDANVIFYVSGFIARSVVRTTRCDDCREALIETDQLEPIQMDEALNYTAAAFLNSVNRGGLSRPTEYCFNATVNCWRAYEEIRSSADMKNKLLTATNQRTLFVKIMDRAMTDGQMLVEDNCCTKGHDLKTLTTRRFFNCVAKNLAKELTAATNPPNERPAKKRKVSKLTSQLNCQ
jgi:hypothetical protein